ncbi:MAG: hypothetical protein LBR60_03840 [Fibrobacter sp.]|jgi:hypothetical protein|nr:hypothetical protein [Fibrobacter sp.]
MSRRSHTRKIQKLPPAETSRERLRRIEVLGGFGTRRTQTVPDRTAYSRKEKHKNNGPQGSFDFLNEGSGNTDKKH